MPTYFKADLLLGIPRGIRSAESSVSSQANKQILKFSEMGAIIEAFTKYSGVLKHSPCREGNWPQLNK